MKLLANIITVVFAVFAGQSLMMIQDYNSDSPTSKHNDGTKTLCKPPVKPAVRNIAIDGSYDVRNASVTTDASKLDAMLGGVLAGKGSTIVKYCDQYHIDPLFVTAVIIHESGNGTSKYSRQYNNVAGIMDGKIARRFPSIDACLKYQIKLLAGDSYAGGNHHTIASIQRKYCPVGANNDPKHINKFWLNGVIGVMHRINRGPATYAAN